MQIFALWQAKVYHYRSVSPKVLSANNYLKTSAVGHAFPLCSLVSLVAIPLPLSSLLLCCHGGVAGGAQSLVGKAALGVLCVKGK